MSGDLFSLRMANQTDQTDIKALIRAVHINPTRLDWHRFVVAADSDDRLIGCGQVKPHTDGSRELSSVAVAESWRGRGVARAIIEKLMTDHGPPLWLTCRSSLTPLYQAFGFHEVDEEEQQPLYFRRLRRLVGVFEMFLSDDEHLAIMTWDGQPAPTRVAANHANQ